MVFSLNTHTRTLTRAVMHTTVIHQTHRQFHSYIFVKRQYTTQTFQTIRNSRQFSHAFIIVNFIFSPFIFAHCSIFHWCNSSQLFGFSFGFVSFRGDFTWPTQQLKMNLRTPDSEFQWILSDFSSEINTIYYVVAHCESRFLCSMGFIIINHPHRNITTSHSRFGNAFSLFSRENGGQIQRMYSNEPSNWPTQRSEEAEKKWQNNKRNQKSKHNRNDDCIAL